MTQSAVEMFPSPHPSGARRAIAVVGWSLGAAAVVGLYAGVIKFALWEKSNARGGAEPTITLTRPGSGDNSVLPNAFVAADVYLPNTGHGIDSMTMNTSTVWLERDSDHARVDGNVNTSGAGDAIVFQPVDFLSPNTKYTFHADGVKDTSGAKFVPYTMSFTTASAAALSEYPVAFDKVPLPTTASSFTKSQNIFTGITVGPDHRLYAGTYDGRILRFDIKPDGSLGTASEIKTVQDANRSPDGSAAERLITGVCFDPKSKPTDLICWVSHGIKTLERAKDWSCKVSRLSGPNLENYQDYVVGLPRSWRDHLTFQLAFGPDGALYVCQGSNTSTGAPDKKWGYRTEHLLNAACLRLDVDAVAKQVAAGQGPLNVQTEDGGKYDPFASDAPLTLYATGIRCGYDILWHSNGSLYVAVNGSAAGGATPGTPEDLKEIPRRIDQEVNGAYTGPDVPALPTYKHVIDTQDDVFLRVEKGRYYGHPNAIRGEYVLNGGNPTPEKDVMEVLEYPEGTQPDRNYQPPAWDLGKSVSANGMMEYKGSAFGGALNGKILVTRYSGGKDILLLSPGKNGKIEEAVTGIDGFTQFVDPLDLTEDPTTGFIYVAEFGGQRLTLLKPKPAGSDSSRRVFRQAAP